MASFFIGDIDKKTDEECEALAQALQGLEHICYTTHSHKTPKKDGLNCLRVIIALDKEYDPKDHEKLWRSINTRLGGLLDQGARTPEHGYYLPAFPEGFGQFSELWHVEGKPLCVADLLSERGAEQAHKLSAPPSRENLSRALRAWGLKGEKALALLNGENKVPVKQGKRNGFLISLAGYLANLWPSHDPQGIAQAFAGPGWDTFNADGKYSQEVFVDMIQRMQAARQAEIEKHLAKKAAEIKQKTNGKRDGLLTPEEAENLKRIYGDEWTQHLVAIQKRSLFFLRPDGSYDPRDVLRESLYVATRDRLAVFENHIEYTYETKNGDIKKKTPAAFLEQYGTIITNAVYDMSRPRGGWDAENETILFPAATPRVEPREHPEIQTWLKLLGLHTIDLLSVFPKFDQLAPALVLTGPRSSGKTLLALGMGRVYGSDPIEGELAFQNFNATLMIHQPIIFMDEKVASAYKREGTTLIRRFTTQGSRMLDEKYMARVELRGYPRLIIAANNIDVLTTDEEMSADDRAAFAERLVHCDTTHGLSYLAAHADNVRDEWLGKNHLAEHILWLSENWQIVNKGTRFAVASNHTPLHDGLASRSGVAGDVAYWLLSFLASPERVVNAYLPIEHNKENATLRVNSQAVVEGWAYYLRDYRPPSVSQIGRALRSLSKGGRKKIAKRNGEQLNAYDIDLGLLASANDTHQIIDNFDQKIIKKTLDNDC
jgi:hypothetical protein